MGTAFFLAELGDKTMLVTITLATAAEPWGTWLGSTLGMVAADAIAIAIGAVLGARLPERAIKVFAAVMFVVSASCSSPRASASACRCWARCWADEPSGAGIRGRPAILASMSTETMTDPFAALGLGEGLVTTLKELGYEEPTPIQREAIPQLLAGRDVLAEAPRAPARPPPSRCLRCSDSTASRGDRGGHRRPVAMLVLVPTRELAMQVSEAIHRYGARLGIRALPVYGGQAIGLQLRALRAGVDVVVATPGRAMDHLQRGSLDLTPGARGGPRRGRRDARHGLRGGPRAVLGGDPGGAPDGALLGDPVPVIARVAKRHLQDPVGPASRRAAATASVGTIRQVAYVVRRNDKLAALCRILDLEDPTSAFVFARTRGEVDDLAERLSGRGHDAAALHGGLSQEQRDRIMARFREGALDVLVATDVAARGLDIEHVSHVVNYDVPTDPDSYVHRIGRTGRAGRTAWPSPSSSPASTGCCGTSRRSSARAWAWAASRASRTCGRVAWTCCGRPSGARSRGQGQRALSRRAGAAGGGVRPDGPRARGGEHREMPGAARRMSGTSPPRACSTTSRPRDGPRPVRRGRAAGTGRWWQARARPARRSAHPGGRAGEGPGGPGVGWLGTAVDRRRSPGWSAAGRHRGRHHARGGGHGRRRGRHPDRRFFALVDVRRRSPTGC